MGCKHAAHLGAKVLRDNTRSVTWGKGCQNGPECNGGRPRAHSEVMPRSFNALVVVRHAVDVAVVVDGEGNAIQGLGAHHAAEAAGVVRVPESLEDLRTQTTVESPYFQLIFPQKWRRRTRYCYPLLWVFMSRIYGKNILS